MKKYRHDWFSHNIYRFNNYLKNIAGKPNIKILEIGSYEGLCTNWLLDNILTDKTSKIYCVDSFEGGEEHSKEDVENLYEIFYNNIEDRKEQVEIFKGYSGEVLLNHEIRKQKFDFIYIDGSHQSKEVLEDAVLSWGLLKKGGIIIFDDYLWNPRPEDPQFGPKISIDSFLNCYKKHLEILEISAQQAIIIKRI